MHRRFDVKRSIVKSAILASTALVVFACSAWAQDDGQTIFKTKCAACHGPAGEGKIGPKLQGTTVAEDDIVLMLSKGNEAKKAPHKKPISGLSDAQVKAVAHYVKSLK